MNTHVTPPSIVGVCFDLDGVLIHTMPHHVTAWKRTATIYKLHVTPRDIYAWEGEPGLQTARRLLRRAVPGTRRPRITPARLVRAKEAELTRLARRVRVTKAWREHLRALRRRGVLLALVTGTSSQEVSRLIPQGVLTLFDALVTGDRVRHGKPHPEPYQQACRVLGIAPRHALVVENAPYGVRSARRAGVGCVIGLATTLPVARLRGVHVHAKTAPQARRLILARIGGPGLKRR